MYGECLNAFFFQVSIYGRSENEWSKLAAWFFDNKLASPNVRWMVQALPREGRVSVCIFVYLRRSRSRERKGDVPASCLVSSSRLWQIPRLYSLHRATGAVTSFDEMLRNIFRPLFAVTLDPASDPKLHAFLEAIVGPPTPRFFSKEKKAPSFFFVPPL